MDQLLEEGMFYHKNKHLYHHEQLVRLMAYNFLENKCTVKPPTLEGTSPEDLGLNDNIVKVAEVSVCDNNLVLCKVNVVFSALMFVCGTQIACTPM